jgi:hypothetical protein
VQYAGEADPYKKPRESDEGERAEGFDVMPSTDPDA